MASLCEMPAGVGGFISFRFPRKRKISQAPTALISHFASAKYFTKTVFERVILSVKNENPSFSYPIATRPEALASGLVFSDLNYELPSSGGRWLMPGQTGMTHYNYLFTLYEYETARCHPCAYIRHVKRRP